jgi:hypothetical protein
MALLLSNGRALFWSHDQLWTNRKAAFTELRQLSLVYDVPINMHMFQKYAYPLEKYAFFWNMRNVPKICINMKWIKQEYSTQSETE